MADVVNLRQHKKAVARSEKEQAAEANRRKFGQSKSEKSLAKADAALAAKKLDGHKTD
jgi:Domain of unknown function (DUF4169)